MGGLTVSLDLGTDFPCYSSVQMWGKVPTTRHSDAPRIAQVAPAGVDLRKALTVQ